MKNYIIGDEIVFNPKPDAVPYNYRISYKLAQICLILYNCCGRSGGSLIKLHMISIALSTTDDMKKLEGFANNERTHYTIVRLDPAVNHAVKYALADGLLFQQKNGLFRLTKKGKTYVKNINKDFNLMKNERDYLSRLADKLTEEKIKTLTSLWRYSNVED